MLITCLFQETSSLALDRGKRLHKGRKQHVKENMSEQYLVGNSVALFLFYLDNMKLFLSVSTIFNIK